MLLLGVPLGAPRSIRSIRVFLRRGGGDLKFGPDFPGNRWVKKLSFYPGLTGLYFLKIIFFAHALGAPTKKKKATPFFFFCRHLHQSSFLGLLKIFGVNTF